MGIISQRTITYAINVRVLRAVLIARTHPHVLCVQNSSFLISKDNAIYVLILCQGVRGAISTKNANSATQGTSCQTEYATSVRFRTKGAYIVMIPLNVCSAKLDMASIRHLFANLAQQTAKSVKSQTLLTAWFAILSIIWPRLDHANPANK